MRTGQLVRWLCWALVVLAIGSAVMTLAFTFDLFGKPPLLPDTVDFVDRLLAARGFDQTVWPFALLGSLLTLLLFLVVCLLGGALRALAGGAAGDVMVVAFVVAGIIGVTAQLLNIALNESAASLTYCDCGYKTYEVIGQAKALDIGYNLQFWLSLGAIAISGLAIALAGWLLNISPTWRWLSYVIVVAAIVGSVLSALGQDFIANVLFVFFLVIAVPLWAILLARGVPTRETVS